MGERNTISSDRSGRRILPSPEATKRCQLSTVSRGRGASATFSAIIPDLPVICFKARGFRESTMSDDKGKREGQTGRSAKKESRQDRLKLALRENLKRRKSQARARSESAVSNSGDDSRPGHGRESKPVR